MILKNTFEILVESKTIGFQQHYMLNPAKPVASTLDRRVLYHRADRDATTNRSELKKIIDTTASLRVGFGWSFEDISTFRCMIDECIVESSKKFNMGLNGLVSDLSGDWIGFRPYNVFERAVFEDLSTYGLIIFNNELIEYQIDLLERIQQTQLYLDHAILRDDSYRFTYFKNIRREDTLLAEGFHYIMDAINNTTGIQCMPRSYIEELIGCHYMHHPDVFFEILNFYTLAGRLYD